MTVSKPKRRTDKTSTKRAGTHLARLAESGGAPVRVDTAGPDLKLLDELVAADYAPSRAEAYRRALREAHARFDDDNQEMAGQLRPLDGSGCDCKTRLAWASYGQRLP